MKSIFSRLYLWLSLILLVFFMLLYGLTVHHYTGNYDRLIFESLEHEARLISQRLQLAVTQQEIDSLVKNIGEEINRRVTVILSNGSVIGETEKPASELGDHSDRPEILEAQSKAIGTSKRYSVTVKKNLNYLAIKTNILGKPGFIRMAVYDTQLKSEINRFRHKFILYIILLYLAVSIIFGMIILNYRKRIREAMDYIEQLKQGKYKQLHPLNTSDEIGRIQLSLNALASQLKKLNQDKEKEKAELTVVINGITDLICVIDKNERIKLSNKSFKHFFHLQEDVTNYYWEIIPAIEFNESVKKAFREREKQKIEIEINSNVFEVELNYIPVENTVIAIFHNISERKQVERIKKDFVGNVSHELKTPLTALAGYLETIEIDPDTLDQFLPILKRNVNRMHQIVKDLLSLSRLESQTISPEDFLKININEIVKRVMTLFGKEADKKGLELKFISDEDPIYLEGEPFLLEEMMINLIDNAIRYTDQGSVEVKTGQKDNRVLITVKDTGIGIPREHVDKIFERFFVVDKGRSKRTGGTGLGLSIVKHIVMVHRGTIELSSIPEQGTSFMIKLPAEHRS